MTPGGPVLTKALYDRYDGLMAFEHDNTLYGSFGEFIPVPEDVDWSEHDAEAEAYFSERDAAEMFE